MTESGTPERVAEARIAEWLQNPNKIPTGAVSLYAEDTRILSLMGLGLTVVPNSLRVLERLEHLALENNQIGELPSWIGELSSLKLISLGRNKLRRLPPEIGSLTKLKGLYLDYNKLDRLP